MRRFVCFILALLLMVCALPVSAEELSEKGTQPTATPAPEISPIGISGSGFQKNKSFRTGSATAQPEELPAASSDAIIEFVPAQTAAPVVIPDDIKPTDVQDPVAFSGGTVRLYSVDDNAYCKRKNYELLSGSVLDFSAAYAEICKANSALTYLGTSTAPNGWVYHCFAPAAGTDYSSFSTSSGDWQTPALYLSICFHMNSSYITLRYSLDFELRDLGQRLSAQAPALQRSGSKAITAAATAQPAAASTDSEQLKAQWLSENRYYYNQLSEKHQQAFETVLWNALHYPIQNPSRQKSAYHQALGPMIKLDNPRIFWVDWVDTNGRLRYDTGSVAHYDAMQLPEGETLASLQQTFLDAIPKAVAQIEKTLPNNASDRDIVKAIHDWLCINNSYNSQQTSSNKKANDPLIFAYQAAHSAYSAMIPDDEYQPVCEGYAGAFQILCEEFGIEAICVSGITGNNVRHGWNQVKLDDGKWYLVDVDADDLASSYNHQRFLLNAKESAEHGYTPDPYVGSGINPNNGYTEGAAFTVPDLAK